MSYVMVGCHVDSSLRPRDRRCSTVRDDDLVKHTLSRLTPGASIEAVLVDHEDRTVLKVRTPDGRGLVVKINRNRRQWQREAAVMEAARIEGCPAPPVLDRWEDTELGVFMLVLPNIDGTPLTASRATDAWRTAGSALRLLHHLPLSTLPEGDPVNFDERLGQELDEDLSWLSSRRLFSPDACQAAASAIGRAFGQTQSPRVILHGDAQPDHFLMRGSALSALVDFGDAEVGDPLWDLAVLTLSHQSRWNTVALGYGWDGCDEFASRRLPAYWLLRRLGEPRWLERHGYQIAEGFADDMLRLLSYVH